MLGDALNNRATCGCHQILFVPLDSFVLLRLPTPFAFLLRFYERSAEAALTDILTPEPAYSLIKSLIINRVLLKIHNVLVELLSSLRVGNLVKNVRVSEISRMKLKV